MTFRDLKAEEIEVRVQSVKRTGVVLLLYKDARVDQSILDETVGAARWQKEFYSCKDSLFCKVGIKCDDEWIWKADCGTESNMEAKKGEASDSFKRACFNWGIGRELYTSPFIFIPVGVNGQEYVNIKDGKCYDKFIVEKIKIENKQIVGLSIINETLGRRVFVYAKEGAKK